MRLTFKRFFLCWGLCSASLLVARPSLPTFKLGVALPLSGRLAPYGNDLRYGLEAAKDDLAKEHSALAERIEILARDNEGSLQVSREVIEALLKGRQADLILGSITSLASREAAQLAAQYHKPFVNIYSGFSQFAQISSMSFQLAPTFNYLGQALALFAWQDLKVLRASIVMEQNSPFAQELMEGFQKEFQSLGGQILTSGAVNLSMARYDDVLGQIRAQKPQAILMATSNRLAASVISRAYELGLKSVFLGAHDWGDQSFRRYVSKRAVRNHYYVQTFYARHPADKVRLFTSLYEQRFNRPPTAVAAAGYDAMMYLASALSMTKSSLATAVARLLAKVQKAPGLLGTMRAHSTKHTVIKPVVILKTTTQGSEFVKDIVVENPL